MAHQKYRNYRCFQDMISPLPDSIFVIFVGPQDSFESLGELFHVDNKLLGFAVGIWGLRRRNLLPGSLYPKFCCWNGGGETCFIFPTIFIQPFFVQEVCSKHLFDQSETCNLSHRLCWFIVRIRVNYVGRCSVTIWCHGNLTVSGIPQCYHPLEIRP